MKTKGTLTFLKLKGNNFSLELGAVRVVLCDQSGKFKGTADRVSQELLIELIAFGVCIYAIIVIVILLLDLLLELLVFLGLLPLFDFRLQLLNFFLSVQLRGFSGDFDHSDGSADSILITVDAILHVDHLEI